MQTVHHSGGLQGPKCIQYSTLKGCMGQKRIQYSTLEASWGQNADSTALWRPPGPKMQTVQHFEGLRGPKTTTVQHFGDLQGPKMHTVQHFEGLHGPKANTVQHFGGLKAPNCRQYIILGLQAKPATQTATLQKSRVAVEVFYLDFEGLQFGLQAWAGGPK